MQNINNPIKKVVKAKPRKRFPETGTMLPNRYNLGVGVAFPLVKDVNGDEEIAGTRYSRKRQHYPV